MNEDGNFVTDFHRLCRFCLTVQEDLVDLFETGIYDIITETTRLELSFLDGLVKNICLECKRQTEEIYRFVCLVKSSDERIASFSIEKEKDKTTREVESKEELFLIVVPKLEASLNDHTYPKGNSSPSIREPEECSCNRCGDNFQDVSEFLNHLYKCLLVDNESLANRVFSKCPFCGFKADRENSFFTHLKTHESKGIIILKLNGTNNRQRNFKINLNGRKCKECQGFFESEKKFVSHAREYHGVVFGRGEKPLIIYECPVCSHRSPNDLDDFLGHLSCHAEDGVFFVKTDLSGNPVPVKRSEAAFLSTADAEETIGKERGPLLPISTPEAGFRVSQGKYSCDLCSETFEKKARVSKHLKKHFFSKDEYVCEKCGTKCSDKTDFDRHFSSRHSKGNVCLVCKKIFPDQKKLRRHSAIHQVERNEASLICETCGNEFSTDSGLARHKKIHSAEKGNSVDQCRICDRTFPGGKSLERHEAAHFDPNFFECEICRLPLPSLSRLRRHSETHRPNRATWECDVCDLSFLSEDGLSCHRSRTGHVGNRKPLECNVCFEKFHVAKKFADHVKLHPKYKTSECSLCGKRLSTLQSLSLHMKRHFESDGILCPECGRRFFEERNYRRHLLTHRGIRPHPCDYPGCGKSFYTLFEIKRHKKYHFDTRDFPCPYCSKKFHESNHLKVHTRTHTGEKPYVCPHCRKGFVTRTRCKQHIKLIHRGEGYDLIQTNISKKVPVFETVK